MVLPNSRVPYRPRRCWWWHRLRLSIKVQLNEWPRIQRLVLCTWKGGRILRLRCKSIRKTLVCKVSGRDESCLRQDDVYWVSPQRIVYASLLEFDFSNRTMSGDWDRLEKRFEDLDVYLAFRQVCIEGKEWKDTVFYQRFVEEVEKGHFLWGCRSQDDADRRCKALRA